jgi:hypothetical protein
MTDNQKVIAGLLFFAGFALAIFVVTEVVPDILVRLPSVSLPFEPTLIHIQLLGVVLGVIGGGLYWLISSVMDRQRAHRP